MDARLADMLACPNCGGNLDLAGDVIRCIDHGCQFSVQNGIPVMLPEKPDTGEITDDVTIFDYQKHYTLDSEQFDYFEERHGATEHSERRLREYILSLVPKTATSILDAGCGSAWVAKAFQKSNRFICSLDISIVNPSKAMERYPSPNHVGVVGDSYHLPFKDGSFDAIIAAEIMEHLHDPQAFASELMRVLRQGGTAVISTPYREKLVYEICIHCHQTTPHNAHLHSWNDESLKKLFKGSAKAELSTFNNKLLLFGRTYPVLKYLPFKTWKAVDVIANSALNKPVNCILRVTK